MTIIIIANYLVGKMLLKISAICCVVILSLYSEISNAQCGQPIIQPQLESRTRVVNGQNAKPHSWPWTVWVTWRDRSGMGFTCGGTLIGQAQTPGQSDIVITAAHCVLDEYGT